MSNSIGSACALTLAAAQVDLALTYSTNRSSIEALTARLSSLHPDVRVSSHRLDLADSDAIQETIRSVVAEHGQSIDILVSNAGYGKRITEIEDISLEEFDHMLNINLRASFVLAKCVIPGMRTKRWGRIVFVSSIAAYGGGINGCRKFEQFTQVYRHHELISPRLRSI